MVGKGMKSCCFVDLVMNEKSKISDRKLSFILKH